MSENLLDGQAQIWWWNGATYDATAFWFTMLYDETEAELGYAGWGDFLAWTPIKKEFAPGEAFWINVNDTVAQVDAWFTMAGQVASLAESEQFYTIPLTPNVQEQVTNPFPAGKLDIQDIKMSENLLDGQAQIWWWNGATYDATAFWFTMLYDETEAELGYPGWGDFLAWTPIVKEFDPGDGFWISVNDTVAQKDAYAKFPNPFYKAPAK